MQGGGGEEELSIAELASNLSTYKDQLQQVRKLLVDDPRNSEYADMEKELKEVIALTEELLSTAKQGEIPGLYVGESAKTNSTRNQSSSFPQHDMEHEDGLDDAEKFPVGTKVQAVWSEDGEWYNGTIEAHTPNGYFVSYDEWGNKEEVFGGLCTIFYTYGAYMKTLETMKKKRTNGS